VSAAAKKPHPEDLELAKLIASATEFSAYIRRSPTDKTVLRHFPDYERARAAADELEKSSSFGRRALVYAITPKGYSIPCSPELVAMAEAMR
jgi:hypothetical protein